MLLRKVDSSKNTKDSSSLPSLCFAGESHQRTLRAGVDHRNMKDGVAMWRERDPVN